LSQLHPKTILTGGLNIPLLYENIHFKHSLADTQDITVNPTTQISPPKNTWLIAIGALGAGVVVLGIIAAAGSGKEGAQKK
jgi:hypothetical protein